jgi:hypothetical protein
VAPTGVAPSQKQKKKRTKKPSSQKEGIKEVENVQVKRVKDLSDIGVEILAWRLLASNKAQRLK